MHVLETLPAELWALTLRADTLQWKGRAVLSLEGFNRLSRHVITNFIERGPTDRDDTFDYRSYLPGIVRVQMAPQYWIWRGDGFTAKDAPKVLGGFVDLVVETLANPDQPATIVDMNAVLETIEKTIGGTTNAEQRRPMIGLYLLWHRVMAPEHHRPRGQEIIDNHVADIEEPCMAGFAVAVLTGHVDPMDDRSGPRSRGVPAPRGCPRARPTAPGPPRRRAARDRGDEASGRRPSRRSDRPPRRGRHHRSR